MLYFGDAAPRPSRGSDTYERPPAAEIQSLTDLSSVDAVLRYGAAEERASLLRATERADAMRFIDRYELTRLDAAYALLYFHSIERSVAAAMLGDSIDDARKHASSSLFPKTGVRSMRELRQLIAAFVAELASERD